MRETIEVMRRLLNMERVTFHGEFHNVEGIELDVVHGRREPRHIPIMIGATGDQMMEMTGEIADGVVMNYCVPPEYNDKELLCQYLAQQPHIAKASGVSQDVIAQIQSILGWPATKEQINKAKHLVPDDLVYRITASGTPAEARTKVEEYNKRGCTCPILYPVGGNFKLLIDTFAQN